MADFGVTVTALNNAATQVIYGLDYAGVSGANTTRVDVIVDDGIRNFFTPVIRGPGGRPQIYIWSFLYSNTTLGVFAGPASTFGASGSVSSTTVTITTAAFTPDDAATGRELIGQTITLGDTSAGTTEDLEIASVTSSTVLVTTAAATGTYSASNDTFSIALDGDYDLPADFGGLVGRLTFDSTTGFPPISVTSESRIREWRQDSRRTQTFRPAYAAVRPRTTTMDTTGQRFELMLWPTPGATYTLHYSYVKIITDSTGTGGNFLPGGPFHSQTLLSSVRAAAEDTLTHTHPTQRPWRQRFLEQLDASIAFDQASMSPETLGISYDAGVDSHHDQHYLTHYGSPTKFGGVLYP